MLARLYPASQVLHSFSEISSGGTLERTLPDYPNTPASCDQRTNGALIIGDVAVDLLAPKVLPRRGPFEEVTVMPVPEAAIYEYDGSVSGKNQIGPSRQVLYMQTVA